ARLRVREPALIREQLAAQDRLLLRPGADDAGLLLNAVTDHPRPRPRSLHGSFRRGDGCGHALVLGRDGAEIVELVEGVVEAASGENDVDGRRLVLLVDVDETQV